ncbi:hypothetical protein HP532_14470 [Pseudomonas sp. CrR25]|nr:hypothetical protein [Pseudomonas sp. CrR25]
MNRIHVAVVALVLMFSSAMTFAGGKDYLLYQQVRSQALLTATHALIYYMAESRTADSRNLDSYQEALRQLEALLPQLLDSHELQQPLRAMKDSLTTLEGMSRAEQAHYAEFLIDLLDAHALIKAIATRNYNRLSASAPKPVVLLNEQSQDISDLLLAHQARVSRVVGEYSLTYELSDVVAIDKKVDDRFRVLKEILPEHTPFLSQQQMRFRFVRGQLLGNNYQEVSGSSTFYLEKVILNLESLARSISD